MKVIMHYDRYSPEDTDLNQKLSSIKGIEGKGVGCLETGKELFTIGELVEHYKNTGAGGHKFSLKIGEYDLEGLMVFVNTDIDSWESYFEEGNLILIDEPIKTCVLCKEHSIRSDTLVINDTLKEKEHICLDCFDNNCIRCSECNVIQFISEDKTFGDNCNMFCEECGNNQDPALPEDY